MTSQCDRTNKLPGARGRWPARPHTCREGGRGLRPTVLQLRGRDCTRLRSGPNAEAQRQWCGAGVEIKRTWLCRPAGIALYAAHDAQPQLLRVEVGQRWLLAESRAQAVNLVTAMVGQAVCRPGRHPCRGR